MEHPFGAVILAGALWVLAGLRSTRPVTALLAGAALVLVAAAASTSAAVAKDGVLAWERWDPSGSLGRPISVSYVWDAQYGGIEFSKKETTVLRITGPKRGLYWRATTLDQFDSDRWLDNPIPLSTGLANGRLPNDPLLPTRSLDPSTWVKQDVEIGALRDQHIIGAAQPVALEAPQLGGVFHLSGGIVRVYGGLERGQRYTVYSYAPRPEPADLAQSTRSIRPGSSGSSTSAGRASSRSARPVAMRTWRRSSTTSATSRCGRTRTSGTRPSGCAPARGRRTEQLSRSRRGCAAPAASATTSRRLRPAACRRSPIS